MNAYQIDRFFADNNEDYVIDYKGRTLQYRGEEMKIAGYNECYIFAECTKRFEETHIILPMPELVRCCNCGEILNYYQLMKEYRMFAEYHVEKEDREYCCNYCRKEQIAVYNMCFNPDEAYL